MIGESSITSKLVGECTKKDTVLLKVLNFVSNGWPTSGPDCKMDALKQYFNAQMEICEVNGVQLRYCRMISTGVQSNDITLLHQYHRGIIRMKTMAQLYACMVSKHRDEHRNLLQSVQCLRCYSTNTSCQLVPMATAQRAVGAHSRGLRWPISG